MDTTIIKRVHDHLISAGIPVNTDEIIATVLDMTGQDVSQVVNPTQARQTFSSASVVRNLYRDYRASHNIGAFTQQYAYENGFMFLGRRTTPNPSIQWDQWYDTMAQMNRHLSRSAAARELYRRENSMPLVISEYNRVDWTPEHIGEQDHFHIQVIHTDGMLGLFQYTGDDRHIAESIGDMQRPIEYSTYFDPVAYTELIAPAVTQLEERGWTLVKRTMRMARNAQNERLSHEIVIGALPPAEDEGLARQSILLLNVNNYTWAASLFIEMLWEMGRRIPEPSSTEVSEDTLQVLMLVRQASAALNSVDANVRELRDSVTRRRADMESYRNTLASTMRAYRDENEQLRVLSRTTSRIALDSVMNSISLPEMVGNLRQVSDASIEVENERMFLKFTTHPFGMRLRQGGYYNDDDEWVESEEFHLLELPPMTFKINLTADNFDGAVKVSADGLCHPHVQAGNFRICWGGAATPLAEAWARRDWESFIRVILAWCTQHEEGEEYITPSELKDVLPEASRSGWLIPEEQPVEA